MKGHVISLDIQTYRFPNGLLLGLQQRVQGLDWLAAGAGLLHRKDSDIREMWMWLHQTRRKAGYLDQEDVMSESLQGAR